MPGWFRTKNPTVHVSEYLAPSNERALMVCAPSSSMVVSSRKFQPSVPFAGWRWSALECQGPGWSFSSGMTLL